MLLGEALQGEGEVLPPAIFNTFSEQKGSSVLADPGRLRQVFGSVAVWNILFKLHKSEGNVPRW